MSTTRRILHIDLDAFYCAVEEQRDPSLKRKPFAVGGSPDKRGVVASCSYPARKYGVHSAMPMARAVQICPDLIIVRGHYRSYKEASHNVMDILKQLTPRIEQISIDEAFMDISLLPESSEIIAIDLQSQIGSKLELPCSIGIAANMLVAKMATNFGKSRARDPNLPPNAIHIIPTGNEIRFLDPLPIDDLWGVGPKTAARLVEMKIETIGDLANAPQELLIKRFGKLGYALGQRAQGIDERSITTEHAAKSVSQERTFEKDIREEEFLLKTIQKLSGYVSRRLIKKHVQATTIKIKLRWPDFTTITRQVTLSQPTNDGERISDTAKKLFLTHWKPGQAVRLIGVGVTGLAPEQLNLWDHQDRIMDLEEETRLNTAIISLREKFGDDSLKWGENLTEDKRKPS
jgi:DNA polymerase-4